MKHYLALLLISSALSFTAMPSHAKSLESIGDLPGGTTTSRASGVSGDGTVVLGNSSSALSANESIKWTEDAGLTGLGIIGPSNASNYSTAASFDGSVIVGYSGSLSRAYIWTQGAGLVSLGLLPGGSFSRAADVSADGTFVVGAANVASGYIRAMYWTQGGGMVDTGLLAGANPANGSSSFMGVSGDGSVAVGSSSNAAGPQEAIRWTQGTGLVGLGFLPGDNTSVANGISADGTTIVGSSSLGFTTQQAFRWTQGGGMVGLGYAPGHAYSSATATNEDGSIIVGNSTTAGFVSYAFRWTQSTGMLLLSDYLTSEGIDITAWTRLTTATGISDDGNIIAGYGILGGNTIGFVANLLADAVTSQQNLGESLNTVAEASQGAVQQTMQYAPQGIFAAQNLGSISAPIKGDSFAFREPSDISPAAGESETLFSVFALGSYGIGANQDFNNDQWNGTFGISAQVAEDLNIGGGLIVGKSHQELDFDGKSNLDALGGLALVSYEPGDNGFRLYATAYATDLKLEIKRGYENGAGLDSSLGKTDGAAYGTAVKLGWETALDYNFSAMPYVEGRYAKTKIDAYEEQGGAFAASFSKQDNNYAAARLGVEFDYKIKDNLEIMFRPAWGYRLTGDSGSFTADVSGLTQSLTSDAGDRNWAELTIGAKYEASDKVKFTTELTGRSGDTAEPAAQIIFGASARF